MNLGGYAGEILRIDLSKRIVTTLTTKDYASRFLGGRGIATKIYFDEVSDRTKVLDPENCLIFVTGPAAGFTGFAGCRWQICTKSLHTGFFSCSNLGGSWGTWLKYAGYDGVIVIGSSDKPVYIYIEDHDKVEIRDAFHIWGKTTLETRDILKMELGNDVKVVATGPAGEHMVSFATVLSSENASGGNGVGSIMGSKKLKAVALKVDRKKRPVAAEPERLKKIAKEVFELHSKNWEEWPYKWVVGRITPCYGCITGCSRRTYKVESGSKFKFFCQATLVYFEHAMRYSPNGETVALLANRLCDEYGLDTQVMQPLINWLDLCYKAGIINEKETELPLSKIGSAEFIEILIRKISLKEGFGELLSKGPVKACEQIGKNSQSLLSKSGVSTRTGETKDYDPRLILANALIYATEPRKPIHLLHAISFPLRRWVNWQNGLKGAFLSTEVFQKIAKEHWGSIEAADLSTYEGKALAAKRIQDYGYAIESIILCDRVWPIHQVRFFKPDISLGTLESQLVSAITGMNLDEDSLLKMGEKIFNLQRLVLLREGWNGRKDDVILDYFYNEPLEEVYFDPECLVPSKNGKIRSMKGGVIDRLEFEKMKDEYYSIRDWDIKTGLPTIAKLEELDISEAKECLNKSQVSIL